jgi:radical SAM protein with 4Fe4S-binding SPASM domain
LENLQDYHNALKTIEKCKDCEYRYFCGECLELGNQNTLDLNAPPVDSKHLEKKAEKLIESVYIYFND